MPPWVALLNLGMLWLRFPEFFHKLKYFADFLSKSQERSSKFKMGGVGAHLLRVNEPKKIGA
jgi:hypothetical protein